MPRITFAFFIQGLCIIQQDILSGITRKWTCATVNLANINTLTYISGLDMQFNISLCSVKSLLILPINSCHSNIHDIHIRKLPNYSWHSTMARMGQVVYGCATLVYLASPSQSGSLLHIWRAWGHILNDNPHV